MADYSRKTASDNRHLGRLTSSKFVHLDGATPTTIVPATSGCSLVGVILNTNGNTLTLRTGSRVIAVIAADAPEGVFPYGVYCENGLIAECGGALDATVKFD